MKEQAIDSALILRKSFEHGEALSEIEISELLKESKFQFAIQPHFIKIDKRL